MILSFSTKKGLVTLLALKYRESFIWNAACLNHLLILQTSIPFYCFV